MKVEPVDLKTDSSERVVKSLALFTFRALRYVAKQAAAVPDAVVQAAADVREAWDESSRPNA